MSQTEQAAKAVTKTITKGLIIKALMNEPLVPGLFFHNSGKASMPKNCKVCAVGAVLRNVSFETWARKNKILEHLPEMVLRDVDGAGEDFHALLNDGNYLGALSNFFEEKCDEVGVQFAYGDRIDKKALEAVRLYTVAWVKQVFPDSFQVTADPADFI